MKEELIEPKPYKSVEKKKEKPVFKQIALKDFRRRHGGRVILEVKKGDDVSKLNEQQKALLKSQGVI